MVSQNTIWSSLLHMLIMGAKSLLYKLIRNPETEISKRSLMNKKKFLLNFTQKYPRLCHLT